MRLSKNTLALLLALGAAPTLAQSQNCIDSAQISRWETLSSYKAVVYDQTGSYLAFVDTHGYDFIKGEMTIRLFSKSVCPGDTIVVNGKSPTTIARIERIRRE